MINKDIINRLAFIKHLYQQGFEQSYKPQPFCSQSVLHFHDAVELFCQLAIEFKDIKNINKKKILFEEYWNHLDLTHKEPMKRFNKARVGLKHDGIRPSRIDIESFRDTITNFFIQNTNGIFSLDFEVISLIDLVSSEKAKIRLSEADKLLSENKIEESLFEIKFAFHELMRNCENIQIIDQRFMRSFNYDWKRSGLEDSYKIDNYFRGLGNSITSLHDTMRNIILGINYKKYFKFNLLTPHIDYALDGTPHSYGGWWKPRDFPTIDEVKFCIDFVIETAVALQGSGFYREQVN